MRDGAREAVEQIAIGAIGFLQAVLDQADHDVVRHEAARIHDFFRCQAQFRAFLDRRAQHVARGDLWNIVFFFDEVSLGALAGTGCS
ncbi:hypothetical protein D3C72_1946450 [compost metagenome]